VSEANDLNLQLETVASRTLISQATQTVPQAEPKWWATNVRTFAHTANTFGVWLVRQRWAERADANRSGCSNHLSAEADEGEAVFDDETRSSHDCDGACSAMY
jgi:hypothetical protein